MKDLIVDIDGVLADSIAMGIVWFNYQYNTHYVITDINEWDPSLNINEFETVSFGDWMVVHTKDPDFHRDIRPFPGARLVLEDAIENDWTITLATARAPETKVLTEQWLGWNQIPYHKLVHNGAKAELTGNLLIEDSLQNVLDWNGWFKIPFSLRPALLFNTPYNQAAWLPWPIHRVRDWVDVDKYLGDPQDGLHV